MRSPKTLWFHANGAPASGPAGFDGVTAYFASGDHHVYAFDAATGSQKWVATLASTDGSTYPIGATEVGCVVVRDVAICGGDELVAFATGDGSVVWRRRPSVGSARSFGMPAVVGDDLYTVSSLGAIVAVSGKSGAELWARQVFPVTPQVWLTGVAADTGIIAVSFRTVGNHETGGVVAFDRVTGVERWRTPLPPSGDTLTGAFSVALWKDAVIASAHDGRIYGFSRLTGQVQWSIERFDFGPPAPGVPRGYPAGANDERMIAVAGSTLYSATNSEWVTAHDLETHMLLWKVASPGGSLGFEPMVATTDGVYVFFSDLAAFSSTSPKILWDWWPGAHYKHPDGCRRPVARQRDERVLRDRSVGGTSPNAVSGDSFSAMHTDREPLDTRAPSEGLTRALGVLGLAASIVNITIGGGIFRLPAGAAAQLGPAAPLAFLICAVAMGLVVLCFAEAGSRISLTGGVYAYVEVAFGPLVGFVTGVLLWAGITVAFAAVSSFFGDALVALLPGLAAYRVPVLILILLSLALLNVAGVRGASRFNTAMTIAKLLPLVILVVAGLTGMRADNLHVAAWPDASHFSRASVLIIFAFLGVETALVPSAEVENPSRTVPRAIFIAMAVVTVAYLVIQVVAQGVLGASLADQKTPLAAAAAAVMGPAGSTLILVGMAVSMFGYVSGMTLAVPRALYAFARDGFLPAPLASVHEHFRTPHIAIVAQTVITVIVAVSGSFEKLAVIANGTVLLAYAGCCAAAMQLRRRGVQQSGTPFRVPFAALVPVLALLVIAWMLTSLSFTEWRWMLGIVVIALAVFAVTMPSRRARASAAPVA